jgi:integral membrane sensor domain MASE1
MSEKFNQSTKSGIALSVILFGLAYFVSAEAGRLLSFPQQDIAVFWLPSGIYLFALLYTERRVWPFIALAAFVANFTFDVFLQNKTPLFSLLFWVVNSLEAFIGAFLLKRFLGERIALSDFRELLFFLCWGVFSSPILSATIGATTTLFAFEGQSSYQTMWLVWWARDAMGILLVTPLLIAWTSDFEAIRNNISLTRILEASFVFGGFALIFALIYSSTFELFNPLNKFFYWTFPFLLWSALRFGRSGATTLMLIFASFIIWQTTRGYGPFGTIAQTVSQRAVLLQTFLAVISFGTVTLAILVEGQKRLTRELAQKVQELASVESETRSQKNLLQSILDNMAEFVAVANAQGQLVLLNESARKFHQKGPVPLPPEKWAEAYGLFLSDKTTPCPVDQIPLVRALRGEKVDDLEFYLRPANNAEGMWVRISGRAIKDENGEIKGALVVAGDITHRKEAQEKMAHLVEQLQQALSEIKTLRGILPICSNCKKIRNDEGYWEQIENYISSRTEADFSHGICPDCGEKLYGDHWKPKRSGRKRTVGGS